MTGAFMSLQPKAMKNLHWHPNANEWIYVLRGAGQAAIFGSGTPEQIQELRKAIIQAKLELSAQDETVLFGARITRPQIVQGGQSEACPPRLIRSRPVVWLRLDRPAKGNL